MTDTIHRLPITRCGKCARPVIKKCEGNEPAYCDYSCAAAAQPEHTLKTTQSTDGSRVV